MIAYLKGKILEFTENGIICENNGIGYEILMSQYSMSKYEVGDESLIYTRMFIKEEKEFILIGFYSTDERLIFDKLINVSSIGMKTALNILSTFTPNELLNLISKEDAKEISKTKGIGITSAKKLILEMKKYADEYVAKNNIEDDIIKENCVNVSENYKYVLEALENFGFTKQESKKVLDKVYSEDKNLQELMKECLKLMNNI